jgi:hypothetical protein
VLDAGVASEEAGGQSVAVTEGSGP